MSPSSATSPAPRAHQAEVLRAHAEFLESGATRAKIVAPCSSGKTLLGIWAAEQSQATSIIVVVPTLELVRQTLCEWREHFTRAGTRWLAVCDDAYMGNKTGISDLRSTTTPSIIGPLLSHDTPMVVITTYQSGPRLAEAAVMARFAFDLVIFDEAHRTVGVKEKRYARLLFDQALPARRRLFLTATEKEVVDGVRMDAVSMERRDLFGDYIGRLSLSDAVDAQPPILADYRVATLAVDAGEQDDATMESESLSITAPDGTVVEEEADMVIAARALALAIPALGLKKVIAYHNTIDRAERFAELVRATQPEVAALTVHSGMRATQRRRVLEEFREAEDTVVITNARCLTEGINIPAVDAVLFVDPKASFTEIVQCVGRAMRLSPGKKFGYVLVPLVEGGGDDDVMFERLLGVLENLAEADSRMRLRLAQIGNPPVEGEVDLLQHIDIKRAPSQRLVAISEAFSTRLRLRIRERAIYGAGKANNYVSYEEACRIVRPFRFQNFPAYQDAAREARSQKDHPLNRVPVIPSQFYLGRGWAGWREYLGKTWRPFDELQALVRPMRFRTAQAYAAWVKSQRPTVDDIPLHPSNAYSGVWRGWGSFLGNEEFPSYEQAKAAVQPFGFQSIEEYTKAVKGAQESNDIRSPLFGLPIVPSAIYQESGWEGTATFLGKETAFLPFADARALVHAQRFQSIREYMDWARAQPGHRFPVQAHVAYAGLWKGTRDFLGTDMLPYVDARQFVQERAITSREEYQAAVREARKQGAANPYSRLPITPEGCYKGLGWSGWSAFLAGPRSAGQLSFEEASKLVRAQEIRSGEAYVQWAKAHPESKLPLSPHVQYAKHWRGWRDFLGTDPNYLPYAEAVTFLRGKGILSRRHYQAALQASGHAGDQGEFSRLPNSPEYAYRTQGWKGWNAYLSLGMIQAWGEMKTLHEWHKDPRCVVSVQTIRRRMRSGAYSPESALSEPGWQVNIPASANAHPAE